MGGKPRRPRLRQRPRLRLAQIGPITHVWALYHVPQGAERAGLGDRRLYEVSVGAFFTLTSDTIPSMAPTIAGTTTVTKRVAVADLPHTDRTAIIESARNNERLILEERAENLGDEVLWELMAIARCAALAERLAQFLAPGREAVGANMLCRMLQTLGRDLEAHGGDQTISDDELVQQAAAYGAASG